MAEGAQPRIDRRDEVAEAVWRVLDRDGFVGLSMRGVATEMGSTTGMVTYYFRSKRELTDYALELLISRGEERSRRAATAGVGALRATLLDMLPLDEQSTIANRIWVSSWGAALADEERLVQHGELYRASRMKIRRLVDDALGSSSEVTDGASLTEELHAAVLGWCVQAALEPAEYPPSRLERLVDGMLSRLLSKIA